MKQTFAAWSLLVLLSSVAFAQPVGQATGPASTFDVADVHVSPHSTNPNMTGGVLRAGRYEIHQASMVDLIRTAYSIDADKVLGGPSWLEADRFDIIAKSPQGATAETVKPMLQALLADRFKLVIRQESRPMSGFALTVGKSGAAKLKQADGSGDAGCKYTMSPTQEEMLARQRAATQAGTPPGLTLPTYLYTCTNMTIAAFAEGMHSMVAAQTYLDTAVVADQTGLKGAWDFNFKYGPKITGIILAVTGGDTEVISLFDAIDKQLGLKLDAVKLPTPVIVVESVNRKPTENPPGVTTSLPVIPTEFEVADLRLSDPKAPPAPNIQIQPSGRLDMRNYPLGSLIGLAWNLTAADALALQGSGAPKWMTDAHIDLIARMPSTDGAPFRFDVDTLRPALKALLIDRFKMKVHFEDSPRDAYTLVAAKPKLKKADPENRSGCKATQSQAKGAQGAPVSIGSLVAVVTCKNVTMGEFAQQLDTFAATYVVYPVLDGTGLDGGWDFTLTFSLINSALAARQGINLNNPLVAGRGGDAPPQAGEASDPTGGVTLFDAIEKQLGLKLEVHKRPEPVFVIDHIDEKPADN